MRLLTARPVVSGFLRHPAALVAAVFALSCIGDSAGPNVARPGQFSIAPSFETAAPRGIIPLDRIRVLLFRPGASTPALDTAVRISPTDTAADLRLTVPVFTVADTFTAHLALITPAGDTAFRGGPILVIGRPSDRSPAPPIPVNLMYVGVGAGADSIVITTQPELVFTGEVESFRAVVYDNDLPVPNAPTGWTSLDPARATVPQLNAGDVIGGAERGTARIVAQLVTGQADTASVAVYLLPSTIEIVSGNNQSAAIGNRLPQPLVVRLKASDGLVVPDFWVKFTVLGGGGALSTDSVLSDPEGVASASWTLGSLPGSHQVRVSISRSPAALATFTATGITITAASFEVTGLPQTSLAGPPLTVVVTAKDGAGNTVADYNGTVRFTSSDPQAQLPADYTFVAGDNGTHAFTGAVRLRTAGDRTVTVTDVGATSTTGSQTVTVEPAQTALFSVQATPNPVTAGAAADLTVTAKDAFGNTTSGYRGTVHFTSSDGNATLPSDYQFTPTDNGTHVFSGGVTLRQAGTTGITARDVAQTTIAGGLTFTVNPGSPDHLVFTVPPVGTLAGGLMVPPIVVSAVDLFGNVATGFAGAITLTIGTNPAGGSLSGTTQRDAVLGSATFSNLSINNVGNGYTLDASAAGFTTVTTAPFDILAPSGTVSWVNPSGGNWNVGSNWSTGTPPGPTDVAGITLPGTYTVVLDQSVSVAGLQLGGASGTQTLSVRFGVTFTVNGASNVGAQGDLRVEASTLTGSGVVTNQGTLWLSSATVHSAVTNQGLLLSRGSSALNGAFATGASSTLRVESDYTCCSSYLYVTNGFTNNGSIDLTSVNGAGGYSYLSVTNGSLINAAGGSIVSSAGAGGTRQIDGNLENLGTITVNHPLLVAGVNTDQTNGGTIDVNGGDLTLTQYGGASRLTNTGTITIGAGRTFTINYGILDQAGGAIGGAGTLSLYSVTANFTTDFSNGTTALSLTYTTVNGPGTLTNAVGHTLTLVQSTIAGPLINQGTLVVRSSSYLTGAPGTFTTATGSVLLLEADYSCCSSYLYVTNGFTNNGLIDLTAVNGTGAYAYMQVSNGTLVNAPGATILVSPGTGGSRQMDAEIDNRGTVSINHALTIARGNSSHANTGIVDVAGGDLTISQSGATSAFTNTGTVTIGAGRTWTLNYGALNQNSGSIGGAGTLSLYSVTANFATDFANGTTALVLNYSTVNGPGTLTNTAGHTLTLLQSTIAGPFVNQGTLVARSSSYLTGALGTFTTSTGSVIRVEGDYSCCAAYLYVTHGFTNNGLIELTAVNGTGTTAYLAVTNDTLVNAAGATILSAVGTGGFRQLDAQIDNQGTVTLNHALTMSRAASNHSNTGTIDVAGGDLTLNQGGSTPSFTNTGTVTIGAGRTWTLNYGALNQNSGSIGGAGTLSLYSVTANFATDFANGTTALVLNYSTVNGPGTLTNTAGHTLTLLQSTIAGPFVNQGTLVARSSSYLTGALGTFTTSTGSVIRVEGDYSCCAAYLYVTHGFTNNGLIELTAVNGTGSTAYLAVTNNTLVNAAGSSIVAAVGTGGTRYLDVQLDNQGTLTVLQTLLMGRASSVHTNTGTIDISAADLSLSQSGTTPSFTNSGTITVGAGRTWTVTNGTLNYASGSIGGPGTFQLNSVTANLTNDFSNATTGFTLNSSTVNGPGTLTNAAGRSLTIYQTTVAAPFVNQGTLVSRGSSTISSGAAFTTVPGSVIRVEGDYSCCSSTLTVTTSFTNNGLIELTAINGTGTTAHLQVNGTLTNAAGATITVLPGTGGARNLNGEINNLGSISVTQPLAINRSSSAHVNAGTILADANLTVTQSGTPNSFTNNGTFTVSSGNTWTVSGGTLTLATGSTLNGGGALALTNVTAANFAEAFTLSALTATNSTASFTPNISTATLALTLNNATLNGPATLTNAAGQVLTLANSTDINADMAVINLGTLVVHGNNTLDGPFTNTGTLRLEGSSSGTGTLTIDQGFRNDGLIELTNTQVNQAATLTVTNGTLTNEGIINVLPGLGGGARTLNATLVNQAGRTVTIDQTLTMGRTSSVHTNSGTIMLNAGDWTLNQSGTTPGFTNAGTVTVGPGRLWTVNGGALTYQVGSTLNGGGALTLTNVTAATFNEAFTLSALTLTNTTASFTPDLSTATLALTLSNATLNGPGSLTNIAGQTLTLTNSTDINNTMAVINHGTLVVHGSNTLDGTLTNSGTLRVEGSTSGTGTLTVDQGFRNDGAIELTNSSLNQSATLNVTLGTLTNAGTLSVLPGAGLGARALNAQLNNQAGATVTIAHALAIGRASSAHANSGTILLSSGDLNVNLSGTTPSLLNTGTLTVSPGRTLTVAGGAFTQQPGATLDGNGALTLNSVAAANFNTGFTLSAMNVNNSTATFTSNLSTATLALTLNNATLNGPGSLTNVAGQTLTLSNSTDINNTMAVTNLGTVVVHGSNTVHGTFTNSGLLRVEGSTSGTATLTLASGFTNGGQIELTNNSGTQAATLAVTGGTFTNTPGGTITSLAGVGGGARTINGQLTNQGTMTIGGSSAPGTLTVAGSFNQVTTGVLNIELSTSPVPTTGFDRLVISPTPGTASLAGTLNVTTLPAALPVGAFDIVTYSSNPTGQFFTAVNLPGLPTVCTPNQGTTSYQLTCL